MRICLLVTGVLCLLAVVAAVSALILRFAIYPTLPYEELWPAFPDSVVAGAVAGAILLGAFALASLVFGLAGNLRLLGQLKALALACEVGRLDGGYGAALSRRPAADNLRAWLRALGMLLLATAFLLAWYLGLKAPSRYWTSVYESSTVVAALTATILVSLATAACLSLAVARSLHLRARLAADLSLLRADTTEQDAGSVSREDDSQRPSQTPGSTRRMRDWLQAAGVLCLALAPITPYNLLLSTRAYLVYPSWDLVALMWGWAVALGLVTLASLSFGAIRGLALSERIADQMLSPQHPSNSRRAAAYLYIAGVLCLLPTPLFALPLYMLDGSLEAFLALLALCIGFATLSALSFAAAKERHLLSAIASQLESDHSTASAGPQAHIPAAAAISRPSGTVPESGPGGAPRPRSAPGRCTLVVLGVLAVCAATLLCYRQAMLRKAPVEAGLLAYAGRYEDALTAYDWAARVDPHNTKAHENRAYLLGELGRYDEALAACDRAIELDPDRPSANCIRGWVLAKLGRYEEALTAYDRAAKLEPHNAAAHDWRGWLLTELGRYKEALEATDQAIRLDPDNSGAHHGRAWLLAQFGRHAEALTEFDRAIELNPTDPKAYSNKGLSLADLGRHKEALAAYDQAIQLDPDYANAHYNRGLSLAELGRYKEALADFDRGIQLQPDNAWAHNARGCTLAELERYEDAVAAYGRAVELKPDDARAYYDRACAYSLLGRGKEALRDLRRAIELDAEWREVARTEKDFSALRSDPEFRRLVAKRR